MAVVGWTTREMFDRYTEASAADESRKLDLGNLGI